MQPSDSKLDLGSTENSGLSDVITQLYRLIYESIEQRLFVFSQTKVTFDKEYKSIMNQLLALISNTDDASRNGAILNHLYENLKHSVAMIHDILKLVASTLMSLNKNDEYIYGSPTFAVKTKIMKQTKLKDKQDQLVTLAGEDNIDACIVEILRFKLNNYSDNYSAKSLCNYLRKPGNGNVNHDAAIHFVISNIHSNPIVYRYKDLLTKQNISKPDKKYESIIIESRYSRHLLLLEILLREKTSTLLLIKNIPFSYHMEVKCIFDFIFDGYVSNDCINNDRLEQIRNKVIDLLFTHGIDIDVNQNCTKETSGSRSDSTDKWKPIHTAVKHNSAYLCEMIVKHGCNINVYQTCKSRCDGSLYCDDETTPLFSICNQHWWASDVRNNVFKSLLLACSKNNVFPNVNLVNRYMKRKVKSRERILKEKIQLAKRKNIKTRKLEKELKALLNNKLETNDTKSAWGFDTLLLGEWSDIEIEDEHDDDRKRKMNSIRRGDVMTGLPSMTPDRSLCVRKKYTLICYETALHAAVAKCDIDIIKLLLMFGCDTNVKSIKVYSKNDVNIMLGNKYDKFIQWYNDKTIVLDEFESVESVYDILERTCQDDATKIQIENILRKNFRWFPDLMNYYPKYMQLSIKNIIDCLSMTHSMPIDLVNVVIYYFYDFSDCAKFAQK